MFVVAGLIEAGAAPGQPGSRHSADGHTGHHLLPRRPGPDRCLAATSTEIDVGMPKEPVLALDSRVPGRHLINKEDLIAAAIAALRWPAERCFQKTQPGRACRGGRTTPGRAVHRHSAPTASGSSCGAWRWVALVAG